MIKNLELVDNLLPRKSKPELKEAENKQQCRD
jgi:hypothetical protein